MSVAARCCSSAASLDDDLGLFESVEDFTVEQFSRSFELKLSQ